jgi:hypothetical protein
MDYILFSIFHINCIINEYYGLNNSYALLNMYKMIKNLFQIN